MCYVYNLRGQKYIFIHIPKSCGRHIRETIRKQYPTIIFNGWDIKNNFDKAHVPRCLLFRYVKSIAVYNMFTYVRNPYDRAVSTYGHMATSKKTPAGFAKFVKERLAKLAFTPEYNAKIIHAYPQYMFLTDMAGNVDPKIDIRKVEDYETPPVYDRNAYYSDDAVVEIVERIYRRDFELFGYPTLSGSSPIIETRQVDTPVAVVPVAPAVPRAPRPIPRCYCPHPRHCSIA
jgi:hypothetical protein